MLVEITGGVQLSDYRRLKYEFTGETSTYNGVKLRRIRALRPFKDVGLGEIGGWIEKESNLSHDGVCWVADNARVFGDAYVYQDAVACENSVIFECAKILGNACIGGEAKIFGNATILDNVLIHGDSEICGMTIIAGSADISGDSKISDSVRLWDRYKTGPGEPMIDYRGV
jgi:NDP-sugar pyrophosphorylase family protein